MRNFKEKQKEGGRNNQVFKSGTAKARRVKMKESELKVDPLLFRHKKKDPVSNFEGIMLDW